MVQVVRQRVDGRRETVGLEFLAEVNQIGMIERRVFRAERGQAGRRVAGIDVLQVGVVVQFAQQGIGVGRGEFAGLRVAARAMGQHAADGVVRQIELAQDLADDVTEVQHHAAAACRPWSRRR